MLLKKPNNTTTNINNMNILQKQIQRGEKLEGKDCVHRDKGTFTMQKYFTVVQHTLKFQQTLYDKGK